MNNGKYIRWFKDISIQDIPLVGGKNASLGEMFSQLTNVGVIVPNGFCVTSDGYWRFLAYNKYEDKIRLILEEMDQSYQETADLLCIQKAGSVVREMIANGIMPDDLATDIKQAYQDLSLAYGVQHADVAVRSSATAEDLPNASFAGQQESYLNVTNDQQLLDMCKKCMASLFTDRAIVYRIQNKFDHFKVALSIGVQKMIRADLAASGVSFSIDPETGHSDVVVIESSYGLGEAIVQGKVTPDNFIIHKPTLKKGFASLVKKTCGDKKIKMIYATHAHSSIETVSVLLEEQRRFSITDEEVLKIARLTMVIEDHYSQKAGFHVPMDVEWAKDGNDGKLYIIQARPETIHGGKKQQALIQYKLQPNGDVNFKKQTILQGITVGQQIATGTARVITSSKQINQVEDGDILVTDMTDPDWVPIMKRAAGIITNRGGRTCHAAIVSRELGIPALVGTGNGTGTIRNGQEVTLDCSQGSTGYVYDGHIPYEIHEVSIDSFNKPSVNILVNIAQPDAALTNSLLPVDGVGLARIEFIIAHDIGIHPLALVYFDTLKDEELSKEIEDKTIGYAHKEDFFVDKLAQGIALIAAAFYPRPVIVRFSDFKTNEYRNLLGGSFFEEVEENPMIGFRGAIRYYHGRYKSAFALECQAILKVRNSMGLDNVQIMIPFVRTVSEAECVVAELGANGLVRGENNLKLLMMCEIPSNVILIDDFARYFDGFSIGSNDLTQLVLGVDRDSAVLAKLFNEQDDAVKAMIVMAIAGAKKNNKSITICGQAPSDYPEFAFFLIQQGIEGISLNPDAVIPFLMG